MSGGDLARNAFVWLYHMTTALLVFAPGLAAVILARRRVGRAMRAAGEAEITGAEAASAILAARGVEGVMIVRASGPLATFYDPWRRELRLSAAAFDGRSPAAVAVAAHEAGHALQSRVISLVRAAMVIGTGLAAPVAWIAFFAGLVLDFDGLALVGALALMGLVLATLALVPIEADASRLARLAMPDAGLGDLASVAEFDAALAAARFAPMASLLVRAAP